MKKLLLVSLLMLLVGCSTPTPEVVTVTEVVPVTPTPTYACCIDESSIRGTTDYQCDSYFVDVLLSVEDGGSRWSQMTDTEKTSIIVQLRGSPSGSIGEYLYQCYLEGWTGYKD